MSQPTTHFSRDGFEKLHHTSSIDMAEQGTYNPRDATIHIPLNPVSTVKSAGSRKEKSFSEEFSSSASDTKKAHNRLGSREEGRRKRFEAQGLDSVKSRDGTLNALGKMYKRIYNFSVITRYFMYIAPLAILIAVPIVLGATLFPDARVGGTRMTYFCVWLQVLWCSIWVSKLTAHYLPNLFQYLIGVVSSGTRKYALVLASLQVPLSLIGAFVTDLATFMPLMTKTPGYRPGPTEWLYIIQRILFACLFSALVLLVEKLLIQLLSISYHRKQFDDKIRESKHNVAMIGEMFAASRTMFPLYCAEFAEEDYIIADVLGLEELASKSRSGRRSGIITPGRLIQNVQRVGDVVTSAVGNIASEITGKKILNPTATHSLVVQALEKRRSSEALARRIWLSFVLEGKEVLHRDDLLEVFGEDRHEDVDEIFDALDTDGNGDISLDEMVLRVSEFGRERAALANSMRDVDSAISVLDNLLMTVVFVATIFIFVAWLNQNFVTTLATAGTALLSLSFVFATTAQELLGSCIFLFVKHPYDVGDRVDIAGEQLVVERISLLYTAFRKVNEHKKTQVPNIVLNSLWVDNLSRSKAMREQIKINVSYDTTFDDIELLRKEMESFVRENGRDFQPDVEIECLDVSDLSKLQLKIECRHKSNWAIESVRAARRSKFMCALVIALKKIPIYNPGGGGPPAGDKANPNYSVSIDPDAAVANKAQFDKEKNAKRLIPVTDDGASSTVGQSSSVDFFTGTETEAHERAQADRLNQRNVVLDPSREGDEDQAEMERKKTNDLEEIKNVLRKQSTRGRRKPSLRVPSRIDEGQQTSFSSGYGGDPYSNSPTEYRTSGMQQTSPTSDGNAAGGFRPMNPASLYPSSTSGPPPTRTAPRSDTGPPNNVANYGVWPNQSSQPMPQNSQRAQAER